MTQSLTEDFKKASEDVKTLKSRPSNDTLLLLYALYKQGTEGDVSGKKPGMLDLKGRKKYESWESKKGMAKDEAMRQYISLVTQLLK